MGINTDNKRKYNQLNLYKMRKYLWVVMTILLTSLMLGLTACSSDDDPENPDDGVTSEIVGRWEVSVVTTKYYTTIPEAQDYYYREEVDYGTGEYWDFTSSKLTIHDENDLMNGKAVKYSYNKKKGELSVSGGSMYKVKKLTSNSLILTLDSSDGQFGISTTIEFIKQ